MSNFELSQYQKDILDFVQNKRGNLLVNAKAGSGKTSTLLLISQELKKQNKKSLFLAFNKSIVEELSHKIDTSCCEVKTLHSTGLSFVRSYLYRLYQNNYDLEIVDSKSREIVKTFYVSYCHDEVVDFNKDDIGEDEIKELETNLISELTQLMNFCRLYMVNYHIEDNVKFHLIRNCRVLKEHFMTDMKDYHKVIESSIDKIKELFENPETDELTGKKKYIIDYTDMIYLPLYYNMNVPFSLRDKLDYVMVDEAQDLSILQQLFVKKLTNGRTRYIFVGDEKQAIYGFAGADTNSINNIKNNFILEELPLNICYRCPKNIIKLSQDIVPEIDWNHTRTDEGNVEFIKINDLERNLQAGDMILGRKNRDLVEIYKKLVLDDHISVKFKNKTLVASIVKDIKDVIVEYITRYNRYENIEVELYSWMKKTGINKEQKKRSKEEQKVVKQKVTELVQKNKRKNKKICKSNYSVDYLLICMEEFREKGAYEFIIKREDDLKGYFDIVISFIENFKESSNSFTVKSFITYLEKFLTGNISDDRPILSTIHMMKGSEADRIFIYNYPEFPYRFGGMSDDMLLQEENLQYVALTRAKKELYLIDTDGLDEDSITKNEECHRKVTMLLNLKDDIERIEMSKPTPTVEESKEKIEEILEIKHPTPEEVFKNVMNKNNNKKLKFKTI